MFDEAGGELLQAKLPNHLKLDKVNFTPGMFNDIEAGSLLIVDDIRLEDLRDAAARAVEDGSFQRCGLVVLMDVEILVSVNKLKQFNLSLRSMWATTTVLIKPWTGGLTRTNEGNFVTSAVPTIGERIMQGARKLRQLLKGQTRLIAMHRSGRIVHNGPNAPVNLSMALITSTEECSYLRAVREASMAQDAAIGQPHRPRPSSSACSPRTTEEDPGKGGLLRADEAAAAGTSVEAEEASGAVVEEAEVAEAEEAAVDATASPP